MTDILGQLFTLLLHDRMPEAWSWLNVMEKGYRL